MKILIDAGHGGMFLGLKTTPGKRATFGEHTIYEGLLNRAVAHRLNFELALRGIESTMIAETSIDVGLGYRVGCVNNLPPDDYLFLSIHHNASDNPEANGFECFTSPGKTKADKYANRLCEIFQQRFPDRKLRKGSGQLSKEERFYLLAYSQAPAVLTEFSFMTNPDEFNYMAFGKGIEDEVSLLLDWLISIGAK